MVVDYQNVAQTNGLFFFILIHSVCIIYIYIYVL